MNKQLMVGILLCGAVTISATQFTSAVVGATDTSEAPGKQVNENSGHSLAATDVPKNREEVEAKRQAIEDKVASKRAAVADKLSGQREQRCKEKEATINAILDNRASAAKRHFATFQAIQNKLSAFVSEKALVVENAAALELIMNDTAASAEATVMAVENLDFTCAETSAAAPGAVVKEQIAAAKQALQEYRAAVKDYAVAIKAAATPSSDDASIETEGTR